MRVSEAAHRIILNGPDRRERLKQAALAPAIHMELWEKYGSGGLPEDDVLRSYLVFDRKFNEGSVDFFIAEFRETLAFAEITESDTIHVEEIGYDPAKSPGIMAELHKSAPLATAPPPVSGSSYKDFHLYLPNNVQGVLRVPSVISQQDYDLLKTQINNSLSVLQAISGLKIETEKSKGESKQG